MGRSLKNKVNRGGQQAHESKGEQDESQSRKQSNDETGSSGIALV